MSNELENLLKLLEDTLKRASFPPEYRIAEDMMGHFHSVMIVDMEKLSDAVKKIPNGCEDPNCTSCNSSLKLILDSLAFIHKVLDPHKQEYLELCKRIDKHSTITTKLHQEMKKQDRDKN